GGGKLGGAHAAQLGGRRLARQRDHDARELVGTDPAVPVPVHLAEHHFEGPAVTLPQPGGLRRRLVDVKGVDDPACHLLEVLRRDVAVAVTVEVLESAFRAVGTCGHCRSFASADCVIKVDRRPAGKRGVPTHSYQKRGTTGTEGTCSWAAHSPQWPVCQ